MIRVIFLKPYHVENHALTSDYSPEQQLKMLAEKLSRKKQLAIKWQKNSVILLKENRLFARIFLA